MTRIIALSDTHLESEVLPQNLAALASSADIILHAGDFTTPGAYQALSALGRLEAVCGNADLPQLKHLLPERRTVQVEGMRIGLVHMASHGADPIGAEMLAREMDVQVLVFGHLHRPLVEKGERLLVCPGSPTKPRMSAPSAAELIIEDGKISGRIVSLDKPGCDYLRFAESLAEKGSKK